MLLIKSAALVRVCRISVELVELGIFRNFAVGKL